MTRRTVFSRIISIAVFILAIGLVLSVTGQIIRVETIHDRRRSEMTLTWS